jgi:hypothetical protein
MGEEGEKDDFVRMETVATVTILIITCQTT